MCVCLTGPAEFYKNSRYTLLGESCVSVTLDEYKLMCYQYTQTPEGGTSKDCKLCKWKTTSMAVYER